MPIYPSIVKALTLGGSELAVDGVLLIGGEHGDYPWNEKSNSFTHANILWTDLWRLCQQWSFRARF